MTEEKILTRVQKLLDKANANGVTEEERELFLAKADELMMKHSIDEAMLMATLTKEERRKPVKEHFQAADAYAPHWEKMRTVLRYIAQLHRCRIVFHYSGDCTLVGFHEDVEYVKMKWLNVYLHFSKTINPKWDTSLSPEQNAYNFFRAGTAWTEVEKIAKRNDCNWNIKKLRAGYRTYCESIGEIPQRQSQSNFMYKEAFAEGFRSRMSSRILTLLEERDKMASDAGALVAVKDLGLEVDELFYSLFPQFRPPTAEEVAASEAAEAARAAAEEARLKAMTPAERRAYDMEQERQHRQAARDGAAYWRAQDRKAERMSRTGGASRGRASADQVDLSRNEGMQGSNRKEL